jgi:protocatechuate 3,4-dioxygenase beta subunit
MSDLQLRVRRGGVISGKVVDEFGEPMERVQVTAQRYRFMGNERQLTTQASASTDDQGNYRLFGIDPGRYFLRASPDNTVLLMNNDIQQYSFVYAPVYYPGAQDERAASQVEVTAGSMQVGMNFTMTKSRSFRVRGVVQNATGSRGTIMAYIRQRNAGSLIVGGTYRIFNVGPKSEIDVQGLGPGPYTLSAAMSGGGRNYGGRVDLELSDQDVEGVVVPLTTGVDLPGEIRTEEGDTLDPTSISILLTGSSTMSLMGSSGTFVFGTRSESKVGEDGKFVLRDVFPDASSRPVVNGLPQGFYVKSIRLGDQEVLESGIDFSSGASGTMVITLSGKAATVEGSVVDAKSQPSAGATVVLVPKTEKRRGVSQFYKNASTDQQGRFVSRGVQPADYTVYAWEDVESGMWLDAEFMRPLRGESLEVTPGGHHSLQLKAIPVQ